MTETYSVVIPAFNAERTIEACLASVAAQTLPPLEVLVIDDHSPDRTRDAVERSRGRLAAAGIGLVYLRLLTNSGPSVARNTGIRASTANFIAFLDADDTWDPDKLRIVDRHFGGSGAGLAFHAYTEAPTPVVCPSPATWGPEHRSDILSIHRMLLRNPAQTSCVVMRKQPTWLFDESMWRCEDYDLWMRIAERSSILRIAGRALTRLGRPQLSAGGLSADALRMRIGELRVYRNFCARSWRARAWALPALTLFSSMKYLYSGLRRWLR